MMNSNKMLEETKSVETSETGEIEVASTDVKYRFAIVGKQAIPFNDMVKYGCDETARKLGDVECIADCPEFPDVHRQAEIIGKLAISGNVSGIAVSILEANSPITRAAISFALARNVSIITFDSDDSGSDRLSYIGTNNTLMGEHLGKVLLQLDPTGGQYGIITSTATNAIRRTQGLRSRLEGSNWVPITMSGEFPEGTDTSIELMHTFASQFPDMKAIVSVGGWPMRDVNIWKNFAHKYPNITTVCADNLPHQMSLFEYGYVDGLVGQAPIMMGSKIVEVLKGHAMGEELPAQIYGTIFQEVINVPLTLQEPSVDTHEIGRLKYLGFTLAAVIAIMSIGFASWTFVYRAKRVVRASQWSFLVLIAMGTLIFGSSMIFMSFDDQNSILDTERPVVVACTGQVWLLSIGFTTVFSALFSKTWRVNRIWHNPSRFRRMTVTAKDTIAPFVILMAANVLTLSLMTALTPLEFVRHVRAGTDNWNRVISTYGRCESTTGRRAGAWPYLATLLVLNMIVLLVALLQAYQARSIQTEFSESHYIAIVIMSMFQALFIAGPLLIPLGEYPELAYILKVCIVFITATVILVFIFVPKIINAHFRRPATNRSTSVRIGFGNATPERQDFSPANDRNLGLRLSVSVVKKADHDEDDQDGLGYENADMEDFESWCRNKKDSSSPPNS